jgi:hypothetical protein
VGLTNIPNSALANNGITINGTLVPLGGNITVSGGSSSGTGINFNSVGVGSGVTAPGNGGISLNGNFNFTSTGQRILAHMSGSPHSTRLAFQDNQTTGNPTSLGVLAGTTGTNGSNLFVYAVSDPDNSPTGSMGISPASGVFSISSSGTSGGTNNNSYSAYPLTFYITPKGEAARFTNNGNFLIGTTTDGGQQLQVNGDVSSSGTVTVNQLNTANGIGGLNGGTTGVANTGPRILGRFSGTIHSSRVILRTDSTLNMTGTVFAVAPPTNSATSGAQASVYGNTDVDNSIRIGLGANQTTGTVNLYTDVISNGVNTAPAAGQGTPLTITQTPSGELMRVSPGGNFLFATTNDNGSRVQVNGIISAGGFNNTSDYRLKENVEPITDALNKVLQLKPVNFTWKKDGTPSDGFLAHELQAVLPRSASGIKDQTTEHGRPIYQHIDKASLVATLTAALQELNAKVEDLQAKLRAAGVSGF